MHARVACRVKGVIVVLLNSMILDRLDVHVSSQFCLKIIRIGEYIQFPLDCGCHEIGSKNSNCNHDGSCDCKDGFGGRQCDIGMRFQNNQVRIKDLSI